MVSSRAAKEAFVTGHSGTTCWEILLITSVFAVGYIVYALGSWLVSLREDTAAGWAVAVLTILGPSLLSCWFPRRELASNSSGEHQLNILLLMMSIAVVLLVQVKQRLKRTVSLGTAEAALHAHPKSCVTLYRAGITAYTCIAILAVDFPFFPRRLAKAETFGTGLMDIGPGMFVFSSGLGLGLRLIRHSLLDQNSKEHDDLECTAEKNSCSSIMQSFEGTSTPVLLLRAAKSVGPLLLLGLARMVLTKAVDYQAEQSSVKSSEKVVPTSNQLEFLFNIRTSTHQRVMQEHHSEYGVHWNFFFTLAGVACMGAIAPLDGFAAAAAAVAAGTVHQAMLLQPGVSEWLGLHERDMSSFVNANKEGIVSLLGYVALFYLGAACATILQTELNSSASSPVHLHVNTSSSRAFSGSLGAGMKSESRDTEENKGSGTDQKSVRKDRIQRFVSDSKRAQNDPVGGNANNRVPTSQQSSNKQQVLGHASVIWWHARLWCFAALSWVLMGVLTECVQPVSRRFCNAAYVLWVTAMALTQLAVGALFLLVVAVATGVPRPRCVVAEGLSQNQLAAFLLANVLTGMVNMSADTLQAGAVKATVLMALYCVAWGCTGLWVSHMKQFFSRQMRTE